ncbi:hypothetical protein, partial [Roseibacillus persicicus]|uniref:hypothetical protein n=1 Tax=Roseibacillus persicicus TaxID=454148 RepID=UPI00280F8B14
QELTHLPQSGGKRPHSEKITPLFRLRLEIKDGSPSHQFPHTPLANLLGVRSLAAALEPDAFLAKDIPATGKACLPGARPASNQGGKVDPQSQQPPCTLSPPSEAHLSALPLLHTPRPACDVSRSSSKQALLFTG